jgi:hypothetical protein
MKQPKKISESEACDQAINRMLEDVPEEARSYVLFRTVQKAGGMMKAMYPTFTVCPSCGKERLPTEAHNGGRFCRSCREWFPEKAVA